MSAYFDFEGIGWEDAHRYVDEQPTRADMQARIDHQYASGQLDVDQWRRGTEHLSTCDARGTMMVGVMGVRR